MEVKLDSGKGGSRTELLAEQDRLAKRIKLVRGLVIFNYLVSDKFLIKKE